MSEYIIRGLNPIKAIIPTSLKSRPKDYKLPNVMREREVCGSYDHSRSGSYSGELARCSSASYWRVLDYTPVYCKEHRRIELVPSGNYNDLRSWYSVGLHPRFSIRKTLLGAKQLLREAMWRFRGGMEVKEWVMILKASKTPKQFLRLMRPHLFVNYYVGRRRLRLHNWFKEKCEKNVFTVEDFFQERNQEFRRLMLRHGVRIVDVVGRLKLVSEDEEGKLYDEVREEGGEHERATSRYLYVKCPSTGQEYLLAVAFQAFSRAENQMVEIDTPKKARRWTFRLRQDVEFAAEA